ncbi:glycosyltransferase [Luteolibacter marinus]|uniref:glycosyltransferase n=1 Tax=Luteolibacter marinus TaxID=2776705 RepID=UPI0018661C5E|nr:glycosyltransferase [Luteolibacter marinus]
MAPPLQPEILIAHPWMGRGGSEATAMWALHSLQDRARLAFTTASPVDWDTLNGIYGTAVSPEKIRTLPAPKLPGVNSGTRLAYWQRAYFERHCQRLGKHFDLCISAYNPIRFCRPAIQLIGDFSFSEESRLELYPNAAERAHHRPSVLRRGYLLAGTLIAGRTATRLRAADDCYVANSRWTARQVAKIFGVDDIPVLYPPSLHCEPRRERERQPLGFVCMGRITPEKELETIIGILDRVRAAGHPVTLDLLGRFSTSTYAQSVRGLVDARRDWIRTPGFLGPDEKAELFATRTFGLHACRVEAFGISVAEMAAAGLIPFVPAEGGSGEVIGEKSLVFSDPDDAVKKIIARIESPQSLPALRDALHEQTLRFRPERFAENLRGIVQRFSGHTLTPS